MRTGIDTKLAKHAGAQIILILHQKLLFLPFRIFPHLGYHTNRIVGTGHLAQSAGHTMMLVLVVMNHFQLCPMTFRYVKRRMPVFRILLRHFLPEEHLDGCLQSSRQAFRAAPIPFYVFYKLAHYYYPFKKPVRKLSLSPWST